MKRRVKITGIGPVTPAGIGRETFWKGILEPVSRVRPYNGLDKEYGEFVAAYLDNFDVGAFIERDRVPKGAARQSLLAVAGSVLALQDAGVSPEEFQASNCAIAIGSSLMDIGSIERGIMAVDRRGARAAQPRLVYTTNVTAAQDAVCRSLGVTARSLSVQSACCSGVDSIGHAVNLVANGAANIALCGGTESPLHRFPLLVFRMAELTPSTNEMSQGSARPFDLWRTTGVISEGACIFVVEPESSPRKGYCIVSGYGFASDRIDEHCSGLELAARIALAEAGVRPCEIDAINAWGPGHKLIDQAEYEAMEAIFGDCLPDIPVVSVKGSVGVALGAAGPIQTAAAALAQSMGVLPPTVNWTYPDPDCPFNLSAAARPIKHGRTLVNSHGLGGANACLVLDRC